MTKQYTAKQSVLDEAQNILVQLWQKSCIGFCDRENIARF